MRTVSIINLKGGVAKTTTSVNMAFVLSQMGYRVILVDNDKQGDASRWFGRRDPDAKGTDRIMLDIVPDMAALIQRTDYDNLDIITANLNLLTANMAAATDQMRPNGNRIKSALRRIRDQYDFCVIDNAPDLNISTINAVAAADDVLIPIEIDGNTLEGLDILREKIAEIKDGWNPELRNVKCFVTKYDKSREIHRTGLDYLSQVSHIMDTVIRFSEPVPASSVAQQPTVLYSARSNAKEDYETLTMEYLRMIGK